MKFAYARVSTKDQSLALQLDALSKQGCDEIFVEKLSGTIKERPELNRLLAKIRKNDTANWTKEKTLAGLAAARARGRLGGRKKGLSIEAENTNRVAETLDKKGNFTINQILKRLNISKPTLYRYLRHRNVAISEYKKPNKESQ